MSWRQVTDSAFPVCSFRRGALASSVKSIPAIYAVLAGAPEPIQCRVLANLCEIRCCHLYCINPLGLDQLPCFTAPRQGTTLIVPHMCLVQKQGTLVRPSATRDQERRFRERGKKEGDRQKVRERGWARQGKDRAETKREERQTESAHEEQAVGGWRKR